MPRREFRIDEREDSFATRVYLLKAESELAFLDPSSFIRKMAVAHPLSTVGKNVLKVRVTGPIGLALEFARQFRLSHINAKYRVMKLAHDKKNRAENFVGDAVRVYFDVR
jgi:hypothetical protein